LRTHQSLTLFFSEEGSTRSIGEIGEGVEAIIEMASPILSTWPGNHRW